MSAARRLARALSLLVALGIAASCRDRKPPPADSPATGGASPAATAPAADPAVAGNAWAAWPMPNAPLPGLPNPQSYDTRQGGVVVDNVTGLMWQRQLDQKFYTFADAGRRCDGLALAGFEDWRLPSRIELVSLLDLKRTPRGTGHGRPRVCAGGNAATQPAERTPATAARIRPALRVNAAPIGGARYPRSSHVTSRAERGSHDEDGPVHGVAGICPQHRGGLSPIRPRRGEVPG